ncbi:hypothetical protein BT63DRAFT_430569 [Microthyrium microscopicum]|uniref:Chromo domain-containing protein n=1 Tax=Microthyrium microscopicum TaxID=703497 RepID=A0A6A6TUK7_9PEZI|nr:hypothetical protein BT63DRAFT_430569 [Microthyrium microscopicum]
MKKPTSSISEQTAATIKAGLSPSLNPALVRFQYVPRRDLPILRESNVPKQEQYTIIDREPGQDSIPQYILRINLPSSLLSTSPRPPLLRVSLSDLDQYVSNQEIETFENIRFSRGTPDFSSQREWLKAVKLAQTHGTPLFQPDPNVQVIVDHHPHKRQKLAHPDLVTNIQSKSDQSQPTLSDSALSSNQGREGLYEISRIVDHKDVMGTKYYYIEWRGRPSTDNTWLTEDELDESYEKIDEYWNTTESEGLETWQQVDVAGSTGLADNQTSGVNSNTPEIQDTAIG